MASHRSTHPSKDHLRDRVNRAWKGRSSKASSRGPLIKAGLLAGAAAGAALYLSGGADIPPQYQAEIAAVLAAPQPSGFEHVATADNIHEATFDLAEVGRQPEGTRLVVYQSDSVTNQGWLRNFNPGDTVAITYEVSDGVATAVAACRLDHTDLDKRRGGRNFRRTSHPLVDAARNPDTTSVTCDPATHKVVITQRPWEHEPVTVSFGR